MSHEKQEAIELIQNLPEDATTSDIMAKLYFKKQIDKGLQDVAEGRVISHEELKESLVIRRESNQP